jgi:hypothetical protein
MGKNGRQAEDCSQLIWTSNLSYVVEDQHHLLYFDSFTQFWK